MKRQGLWGKKQEKQGQETSPPPQRGDKPIPADSKQGRQEDEKPEINTDNDLCVGMKQICNFTGYSESTIEKFRQEYDDFPIINNGRLVMSKTRWNKFWLEVFETEAEELKT